LLNVYGTAKPGISQIWLDNPFMDNPIVGTIAFNPTDDRLLIFNPDPDTLPQNTLQPVDRIINPHTTGPKDPDTGIENGLPEPVHGQRYLLVEGLSPGSNGWGNIFANSNDIIQYVKPTQQSTGQWEVAFDSQLYTEKQYVTNLYSGVQYRWADGTWMKSYEGWYDQGDYSVVI
jgi:hypothetical protein